jgi:hypothetical protein
MAGQEVSREEWEAKPNSEKCLRIVKKCVNALGYRDRYTKTRIVVDGPDGWLCCFWYAASNGVDCIIEPRLHERSVREVITLLKQVGLEPEIHGDRPKSFSKTIKIPVSLEQVAQKQTWSCIERVLESCATRM